MKSWIAPETLTLRRGALRLISLLIMASSNGRSSRMLRSNCGLCRVFLNWLMKCYIPLACLHPRWHYSTLLTQPWKWLHVVLGQEGPPSILSHTLCFDLSHKNFILHSPIHDPWSVIWSVIRSVIRSVIQPVIRCEIQSVIRSGPIQILSTPQTQGHFRSI